MNQEKLKLIKKARNLYKEIYPCANKTDLEDCFTSEGSMLIFWFNTTDSSTHVLTVKLP